MKLFHSTLTQAPFNWCIIVAVAFLIISQRLVLAQTLPPFERTSGEEKKFQEQRLRIAVAEITVEACIQKEVERDFAIKYVGVPLAIAAAINACTPALENFALADCIPVHKDGSKRCTEPETIGSYIKVRRERLMENWVPVLMKRRVELQPDGPKYLFDFASQFVYAVVASNEKGEVLSQGSAVAVDDRHLATNCHVISKATKISIRSGKIQATAHRAGFPLSGSDRCLLYSDEKLDAFATIRGWRDLNVGERIFAIGVPQGLALNLSLTLSDGLLSGKRLDGKHRLIQTTAPISPGSSGGGLFDSSGRLLGVTTFTLTSGQNLNFAIAAEDWSYELCMNTSFFWGPAPNCDRHTPAP